MPNALYDALLKSHQQSDADFLHLAGNRTLSYRQFAELASRLAQALVRLHVLPGDRVAVQVQKSAEALALYVACVQCGAVFLPLNTDYKVAEIEYFVNDAEPRLLVCDPQTESALQAIANSANASLKTLSADSTGSLLDELQHFSGDFQTVDRDDDDLAAILYTSGTTGRSKGAMMTHRNLLSNAETLVHYWRFDHSDVLLHALPIYHTHGLFVASNVTLLAGASMIFQPAFNVDNVLDQLPNATSMMGVPTFYTRLLDDARFTRERVKHLRLFISGSAPLLAETHVQFEQRSGHRILERYGMTETNMNTSNPYDGDRRAGTVGFPLPGIELQLRDPETGKDTPTGEVGMIEVRGPNVFKGYWRMPEKTAEAVRENGFLITGDLGRIDADGYVQIVGRDKDLVISGGFNVYPKEIELALDEQDGVLESAVIGAPHPDFGEGVVAILVSKPGATIDIKQIQTALAKQLAKFKQPKEYFIAEQLPRNSMGKVQKNILRDQHKTVFS